MYDICLSGIESRTIPGGAWKCISGVFFLFLHASYASGLSDGAAGRQEGRGVG